MSSPRQNCHMSKWSCNLESSLQMPAVSCSLIENMIKHEKVGESWLHQYLWACYRLDAVPGSSCSQSLLHSRHPTAGHFHLQTGNVARFLAELQHFRGSLNCIYIVFVLIYCIHPFMSCICMWSRICVCVIIYIYILYMNINANLYAYNSCNIKQWNTMNGLISPECLLTFCQYQVSTLRFQWMYKSVDRLTLRCSKHPKGLEKIWKNKVSLWLRHLPACGAPPGHSSVNFRSAWWRL